MIVEIIMMKKQIVLTGDRPTGQLHLGHYIGTLQQRVELQTQYTQYVMIADTQALTDYYDRPDHIYKNVMEVCLDYLAVGIDPHLSTIFIQSMIPEIAELTLYYLNLVAVGRLMRNPTVKHEIAQKNLQERLPAGFLVYPVCQAADITIVKGTIVPVGEDQVPHIEQTNELLHAFNRTYNCTVFDHVTALVGRVGRLPGIDGKAKMSKSLGNAIFFADTADVVAAKVMKMYTDPDHIHVHDPGKVEDNVVFTYLDIFDSDTQKVAELKDHYRRGGLGDVVLKKRLIDVLENFIAPIRQKRMMFAKDPQAVRDIIFAGTEKVRNVAANTLKEVKQVMCLDYK